MLPYCPAREIALGQVAKLQPDNRGDGTYLYVAYRMNIIHPRGICVAVSGKKKTGPYLSCLIAKLLDSHSTNSF